MKVLSWARRHRMGDEPGLPAAWAQGVRSFYDQPHRAGTTGVCTGTACLFAGGRPPGATEHAVHCFGRCYEAPVVASKAAALPLPRRVMADVVEAVVLRHVVPGAKALDPMADYDLPSGPEILAAIENSGLRGRGGAAYPTGAKWKVAAQTPAPSRFVVANGDEGDPGSYVDRLLLEESPHAVLAGMVACARAIGADRGVVFIRGEYPEAAVRVREAIAVARASGKLLGFDLRVVTGAGSYVAGEETALLRAIEGLRAEPTPKPPYPAERGLENLPTVIQNVETLAVVPWLLRSGRRSNTKAVCLSGAVQTPGVVEINLGTSLRRVLEEAGGGVVPGRRWKMALVGGPMGRVVPERGFDLPLDFDALPGMGHGGIVVFDDSVGAGALAAHLFDFARTESCGACAPCRIGTSQLASRRDSKALQRLLDTLEAGSLCGFGQGVPRPLRDLLRHFPDEVFA